ncbi:MAG: quinol monooxygenase YgiN [Janthinobacterium sp.]|jgi:quinol monooxygenase YgiN
MIFEIAAIRIKQDTQTAFEAAVAEAVPLFRRAKGCLSMRLEHSIEQTDGYRLVVGWETLDDHIVHFRDSADFQEWRRLVGPYFVAPPEVEHMNTVLTGF